MATRIFTPASARESLEVVRPAAERMSRLYRAMERVRPATIRSDQAVEPVYYRMVRDLLAALGALKASGVRVGDPRTGVIDFPARRAGRAVLLCWKVGEPTLAFWHEVDGGYAGRRPLDENGPWEADPPHAP